MTTHSLKCWPEWFNLTISRVMEFQVREDDRHFQAGDRLRLMEYLPEAGNFTGRVALCRVRHVVRHLPGVRPSYCVMGIFFENLESKHTPAPEDYP